VKSPGTLKGTSQQPQDMHLWEGIELIGCSRSNDGIVNGVTYIVRAVTATTVTVDMDRRFWLSPQPSNREVNLTLSHKDAGTLLRLSRRARLCERAGAHDPRPTCGPLGHGAPPVHDEAPHYRHVPSDRRAVPPPPETIMQEDALMAKAPPLPVQQPAEEDEDSGRGGGGGSED
jgi:hypothetical protein